MVMTYLRLSPPLEPLPETATLAEVIVKVNEIVSRLNSVTGQPLAVMDRADAERLGWYRT